MCPQDMRSSCAKKKLQNRKQKNEKVVHKIEQVSARCASVLWAALDRRGGENDIVIISRFEFGRVGEWVFKTQIYRLGEDLGFRVGFRVWGLGFRVWGRVQGLGVRVGLHTLKSLARTQSVKMSLFTY